MGGPVLYLSWVWECPRCGVKNEVEPIPKEPGEGEMGDGDTMTTAPAKIMCELCGSVYYEEDES
jgi:rubredoxin